MPSSVASAPCPAPQVAPRNPLHNNELLRKVPPTRNKASKTGQEHRVDGVPPGPTYSTGLYSQLCSVQHRGQTDKLIKLMVAARNPEVSLQRRIRREQWLTKDSDQPRLTEVIQRGGREGQEASGSSSPHHGLSSKACTVQWPGEGQVASSCRGWSTSQASVSNKTIREPPRAPNCRSPQCLPIPGWVAR